MNLKRYKVWFVINILLALAIAAIGFVLWDLNSQYLTELSYKVDEDERTGTAIGYFVANMVLFMGVFGIACMAIARSIIILVTFCNHLRDKTIINHRKGIIIAFVFKFGELVLYVLQTVGFVLSSVKIISGCISALLFIFIICDFIMIRKIKLNFPLSYN